VHQENKVNPLSKTETYTSLSLAQLHNPQAQCYLRCTDALI